MDFENGTSPDTIRPIQDNFAVKATRTQKRRIEDIGAVGRRDHDHVGLVVKAIHLDKDLVQRLFAFIMTTAKPCTALAAYRIDLVHKYDRRRLRFRTLEQIADATRAHTNEHLHELRARDAEEWRSGFPGYRAGEESLACSGWPD